VPEEYSAMIGAWCGGAGRCGVVSVHCHDDLGLAVANSWRRCAGAADRITVNGIGERAGGVMEEVWRSTRVATSCRLRRAS
jgi:2-isopropylmalate synthase